jgi:hypothetical protein
VVIESQQQDLVNKPPAETIDEPTTDSAGFGIAKPIKFPGDLSSLSDETAAYWNYWESRSKVPVPSIFQTDYWTTSWPETFVSDERPDPITGYAAHLNFRAGDFSSTWAIPYSNGWAIAFGSVFYTKTTVNRSGYVYQDAGLDDFAPDLPAGMYRSVVETRIIQPWFYVSSSGRAYIEGGTFAPLAIVGHGREPLP